MEAKVGSKVAFNMLPDAVWFDVLEINGVLLTVRESGTDYATQVIDKCAVKQMNAQYVSRPLDPETDKRWEEELIRDGTAVGPVTQEMVDECRRRAAKAGGYANWPDWLPVVRKGTAHVG